MAERVSFLRMPVWKEIAERILSEDVGEGDISTNLVVPPERRGAAVIFSKGQGIAAGINLSKIIFSASDRRLKFIPLKKEGDPVKKGENILEIRGPIRSILRAERAALNCLQKMSGIASLTYRYCEEILNYNVKILDTRKTTPLNRLIEKWAVQIGGGNNHRLRLDDMILIKDNHIDSAGGIDNILRILMQKLRSYDKEKIQVIIEARTLKEVRKILTSGVADRILLDNMSISRLKKAVSIIKGKTETEASGGITLDNIRKVAATGVNYISVGALTHSFAALDMSLKILSGIHKKKNG